MRRVFLKYLILVFSFLVVGRISYVSIAGYLARNQLVIICYNAGFTYSCALVPRGSGLK